MSFLEKIEDWIISHTMPPIEYVGHPHRDAPPDDVPLAFGMLLVVCMLVVTCGVHYCGK